MKKYQRRTRRSWKPRSLVTVLAAIVVFCTTYALILPAITMEREDFSCGLTAHTHGEDCYQLSCGLREVIYHTHDADCWDKDGNLICTLEEREHHVHNNDCYTHVLTCILPEVPAHTHGPECYASQSVLTCTEEHEHTENCFTTQQILTCTLEETAGHTHGDSCFGRGDFVCTIVDPEEHEHTESCYRRTCELEEHTHSDLCISSNEGLIENLDELLGINQNPEISDPEAVEPETTDPEMVEPETTDPEMVEPGISGPEMVEPEISNPEISDPEISNPEISDPEISDPEISDPEISDPEISDPEISDPEIFDPEISNPEISDLETSDTEEEKFLICEEDHEHTEDCFIDLDSFLATAPGFSTLGVLNQSTALAPYLTSVNFDPNFVIDPVEHKIGSQFSLEFYIPQTGGNFPAKEYTLPLKEGMEVKGVDLNAEIPFKYGTYRYEYDQDNDEYTFVMTMSDEFLTGAYDFIEGRAYYDCELKDGAFEDNGDIKVYYSQQAQITVTPEEYYPDNTTVTKDLSMKSTKKGGEYNRTDNTVSYTVLVESRKGTEEIDFRDSMTITTITGESGIVSSANPQVTVKKGTLDEYGNVVKNSFVPSQDSIKDDTLSFKPSSDTEKNISMTLDKLSQNQCYEITYTYQLNTLPDGEYDYKLSNGVTVSTEKGYQAITNNPPAINTPVSRLYTVEKTGVAGKNSQDHDVIHWTITVNKNNLDVGGMHLEDPMFATMVGDITVTPADMASHVSLDSSDPPKILFDSTAGTTTYTITYDTPVTPVFGGSTSDKNTATLYDEEDRQKGSDSDTPFIPGGSLTKEVDGTPEQTKDGLIMKWIVTVEVPAGGIAEGTQLMDRCDNNWKINHLIQDDFEIKGAGGSSVDATANRNVKPNGDAVSGDEPVGQAMIITFNEFVPHDKSPLTITYSTKSVGATTGQHKYLNTISYGSLSDDAEVDYTFVTDPKLEKMSNNGKPGEFTRLEDGTTEIAWKIRATTGSPASDSMSFVEHLPSGVTVKSVQMQIEGSGDGIRYVWQKVSNADVFKPEWNAFKYTQSVAFTDARTLNISISQNLPDYPMPELTPFTIEIKCAVDSDYFAGLKDKELGDGDVGIRKDEDDRIFLKNEVAGNFGPGKDFNASHEFYFGKELPQEGTSSDKPLSKFGEYNDKILSYRVEINPKAENLSANDTLTLEDVLEYTYGTDNVELRLDTSTVKLYKVVNGGEEELPGSAWQYTFTDDFGGAASGDVWTQRRKIITATIPDSTHLVLRYNYEMQLGSSVTSERYGDIKNTASIIGVDDSSSGATNTKYHYVVGSSGIELFTTNIYYFEKRSSLDQQLLAGAKFGVYVAAENGGVLEWTPFPMTNKGNQTYYMTDNPVGKFTVQKKDGFADNTLYMVREDEPPAGHVRPNPLPIYMFYWREGQGSGSLTNVSTADLYKDAVNLAQCTPEVVVYNEPMPIRLPETGGMGTTPVTVSGLLLFAAAGTVLSIQNKPKGKYTKKRGKKQ